MSLDRDSRERALQLIRRVRDVSRSDEESDAMLDELQRLLRCPRVTEIIYFGNPEISDEEILDKALDYRPFSL